MPRNEILRPSYNISTDAHLLFTKDLYTPISYLNEFLGKVTFFIGYSVPLLFWDFILPHPYPIIWLLRSCNIGHALFLQYNDLLYHFHVELCVDIDITTCYQALPLVTCSIKYWWWFSSTTAFSPLLLKIKMLLLVSDSLCNIPITLYIISFNLFQNVKVDGCDLGWTQQNKGWSILFWYSYHRECWNILDAGFYDLRVTL